MATATELTIEQRLAALEAAVAAVREQLATLAQFDGSAQVAGPATNGSALDEVNAPGYATRRVDEAAPAIPGTTTIEPPTSPPISRAKLDDQGRLILPTPAEAEAEAEGIRAMLDELRSITGDPDEDDAEFFRAIDSHRPHRPLFEGLY